MLPIARGQNMVLRSGSLMQFVASRVIGRETGISLSSEACASGPERARCCRVEAWVLTQLKSAQTKQES